MHSVSVEAGVGIDYQDLYVQEERYTAGAGMRRSGFFQIGTA